ncbi:MAG: beta-lactamase family protein [Balneolia bacterium]|nr:beta-lactamase family protein [Balneolia bacterium]
MKSPFAIRSLLLLLMIMLTAAGCGAPETGEDDARPDAFTEEEAQLFAEMRETGILFWTPEMQLLGYRNPGEINPIRLLDAAEEPFPLPDAEKKIEEVLYLYDNGVRDLDYYMEEMNAAGLLVIKDGEIVLEEYRYGNEPDTPWISFSVTKSVLSMMFGLAIEDGYISSVDDLVVEYLPELEDTAYDGVTIRHMLWMSSGVSWNEDYADPDSDVSAMQYMRSEADLIEYVSRLDRAAEPGTRFNYNTAETNLAGSVLKAATGMYLTEYANERIWQAFGMEHDASWNLMGENDIEHGGCCINASLRDYGRIGLMALNNGVNSQGDALLPEGWMEQSLEPAPSFEGYGHFWWLHDAGRYSATGIFGQHIHINADENLIIAMHGKWEQATGSELSAHRRAFIEGLTDVARNLSGEICCSEGAGVE